MTALQKEDLEFIIDLDKKLHKAQKVYISRIDSPYPYESSIDQYTNHTIRPEEIEKVLDTIGDIAFYPINTAMGFAVGFQVSDPVNRKPLLTFKESQLPSGYDFQKLSEYFMLPENINMARSLGIEIINNRNHYSY